MSSTATAVNGSNKRDYIGRSSRESSIGSDITLNDDVEEFEKAQPQPQPPPSHTLASGDKSPPIGLQNHGVKTSLHENAENGSIGSRLFRTRVYVNEALVSSWKHIQKQRLTACQAVYLFVINVTLLVVGLITLITSNQPTDVDRKSLDMQKALLEQSIQAVKTSNETLTSNRNTFGAEKESLELQRASLEKDKVELEVQKQTLELAKWSAYHEYIVGCAAYEKQQITSDRCAEALKAFDQPPPHLPSDPTLEISKRRFQEASDRYGLTAIRTQDGSTSLRNFMAATTLTASLPSLIPSSSPAADVKPHGHGPGLIITVCLLSGSLLLLVLYFMTRGLSISFRLLPSSSKPHDSLESPHEYSEKANPISEDAVFGKAELSHNSDYSVHITSTPALSLPVGLRNRKDNTRQLSAKGDLWTAAFHGDTTAVQELLAASSVSAIHDVHQRFGTPLQAAAQGGHLKAAKIFLKLGANPNIHGGRFHSPLQAAAYSGEEDVVNVLIRHGANQNAVGGSCGSPFLAAVERGSVEMVRAMINAGANIHQCGGPYGHALQIASFRGSKSIVSLLLDHGVDVNAKGGCYDTALLAATMEGHTQIVHLLLQRNVDINWISTSYGSAVQVACRQDHAEIAELLVRHSADISVRDQQRRTPLHEAARHGQVQLVESLLERGIEVNFPDIDGWTPLHHAALNGFDRIVEMLLAKGADVTACDKFGAQPLFRACDLGMGFECTVRHLLDAGADVDACDAKGRAALHCQSADNNVSVHQLLIARGALINVPDDDGQTPLHRATTSGNMVNVRVLLEANAKINLQDNDQATALHIAVANGFEEIALLLLQQPNVDINARSASAFQEAIAAGRHTLVQTMMAKGAALNSQGSRYGGVAQAAACGRHLDVFKMLLDRRANVNIQGGEHGCALGAAAYHGQVEMVELLLEHGANPYIRGGRFGCVVSSAKKSQASPKFREEIVRLLESYGAEGPISKHMPHEHDRWVLTPGGWVWLPQDSL
ncbi:MAG: hypothetical protein Q9220_002490 [cf. Caloplaca sp. 1 TL-2023]